MLEVPGRLSLIAAVLIALSALASSVSSIRTGMRQNIPKIHENHA
jgi:hypothetical protein